MSEPTSAPPLEITLIILGYLHDSPGSSLVPWSLACKEFCNLARAMLFQSVSIRSYWCIDNFKDILCTSQEVLPYIKRVYFGHGHPNALKQPLRHPYLPRFLNLLHENSTVTHLGLGWVTPFDMAPSNIMAWTDFTEPAQDAIRKLARCHSIECICIAHMFGLPANELIDLRRVRTLTLHNVQFDGPSALAVEDGDKLVSSLETLQVSGNDILSPLHWLRASTEGMPLLKRLSLSSEPSIPRRGPVEFVNPALIMRLVQPLILYGRNSIERLDLNTPFSPFKRSALQQWNIDLSPLARLKLLTINIICYHDESTPYGFPSAIPTLSAMLSTIHDSDPVEVRLTPRWVALSNARPIAISSLDAIDSTLYRKNARLHIAPTTNLNGALAGVEAALAVLFRKLREEDRLCMHTVVKQHNNYRFWDDQWSEC